MQSEKNSQKRLNKAVRVKHRFCEENSILHRIGQVLHISITKNMILKAENIPRIGEKVTDKNLKPVGTVFDVFGPTSSPYVAVKPHIQNPEQLVKHILYVVSSENGRKKDDRRKPHKTSKNSKVSRMWKQSSHARL